MAEDDTDGDRTDPTRVPAVVRAFARDVLADDESSHTFEDAVVDVPSRFDGDSPTARWRFDGTLTVRIHHPEE